VAGKDGSGGALLPGGAAAGAVTSRVTQTLIKSLNLQLCHKDGANQVIKIRNQKKIQGVQI
jgi:hypothetical protein